MKKLLFIALASMSAAAFVGCAPTSEEPTSAETNVEATTDAEEAETDSTEVDSSEATTDAEETETDSTEIDSSDATTDEVDSSSANE
ncbi:MAG: hypothetical protein H9893_14645 [Candidatus Niameybacter stercoravium]|nr:hypothetical protein [Candidatus Niameybacter stercoravium]